jgi:hypothetical protein
MGSVPNPHICSESTNLTKVDVTIFQKSMLLTISCLVSTYMQGADCRESLRQGDHMCEEGA